MRLRVPFTLSLLLTAIAPLVSPSNAQQCSHCYTQQSADMRQCPAKYTAEDKAACRRAASEAAAACIRACNQSNKQQDREPTRVRPEPRPY